MMSLHSSLGFPNKNPTFSLSILGNPSIDMGCLLEYIVSPATHCSILVVNVCQMSIVSDWYNSFTDYGIPIKSGVVHLWICGVS